MDSSSAIYGMFSTLLNNVMFLEFRKLRLQFELHWQNLLSFNVKFGDLKIGCGCLHNFLWI